MVAGLTKEHTCAPTHGQQAGSRAQCAMCFQDLLSSRRVRLACERPRKTLYGAILVISVRISTSAVRPPFSKSSVLNQLCVLSMSAEPPEHAPRDA